MTLKTDILKNSIITIR